MKLLEDQYNVSEIRDLLRSLREILLQNQGGNHVPGVLAVISILDDSETSLRERMSSAKSTFSHMLGGMGTLGDFVVWNDDEGTRVLMNQKLTYVIAELWKRLNC
jgi:hypothetical protein